MTRRQWMWLWIWLLLFLIIFCVWNKLLTIKNAQHKTVAPVTMVPEKQTNRSHTIQPNKIQQKDIMFKLVKDNNVLKLSGVFPSNKAVEKALQELNAQGHKAEKGTIIIDPYANNPQLITKIAQFGKSLHKLDNGYLEYKDKTLTIDGTVDNNKTKEEIHAAFSNMKEEKELQTTQKALDTLLKHKRVEFVYAKDKLTPKSRKIIDQVVTILKEHINVRVEIGGHTDSDGEAKRNLKLSQKRAEAVKRYLIKQGIAANRLVAKGYGESKPLVKNDTKEHKQINRRVEFNVIR